MRVIFRSFSLPPVEMLPRGEPYPCGEGPTLGEGLWRRGEGGQRGGGDGAEAGNGHEPLHSRVGVRAPADLRVERLDPLRHLGDLGEQDPRELDHRRGERAFVSCDQRFETSDMREAGRRDDALLRQVTPKSFDRVGALAHRKIPRPAGHAGRLLRLRLHGHEPHGRPRRGFGDGLRVVRRAYAAPQGTRSHLTVVLLSLHERPQGDRRDHLHGAPHLGDSPPPVMRARTP
jgi:hypothetical protein